MLEQLYEEPLGPLVVFRVRRHCLALPVEHGTHRAHLCTHAVDVFVGPLFGVDVVLDRRALRRQAERVEAHREQDVISLHPLEARPGIRGDHREPVADMQVAAGIGQHGQGIVLGPALVDHRAVQLVCLPFRLPLLFHDPRVVGNIPGGLVCFFYCLIFIRRCHSISIYIHFRVFVICFNRYGQEGRPEEEDLVSRRYS